MMYTQIVDRKITLIFGYLPKSSAPCQFNQIKCGLLQQMPYNPEKMLARFCAIFLPYFGDSQSHME